MTCVITNSRQPGSVNSDLRCQPALFVVYILFISKPAIACCHHLSSELLGMLAGLDGKAFAYLSHRSGFESLHCIFHNEWILAFLFYGIIEHVAVRLAAACRGRGGRRRRRRGLNTGL